METMVKEVIRVEDKLYNLFQETIKRYELLDGLDDIVFLFSGGKDATLGLFFLDKYLKENNLNINLTALMVTYPIHVYYEDEKEAECFQETKRFWKEKGVNLKVLYSKEEDLEDGVSNGCKTCKGARKRLVDEYLNNYKEQGKTAIVTGYTLYDILAYVDELCLTSDYKFNISELKDEKIINRVENCLHKMQIKEELPNGFRIIRPLARFNEDVIMDYVRENKIPFIDRPCKVSKSKHKRQYFKVLDISAPINNVTYEGILNFLDNVGVKLPETFNDIEYDNYFTDC